MIDQRFAEVTEKKQTKSSEIKTGRLSQLRKRRYLRVSESTFVNKKCCIEPVRCVAFDLRSVES